MAAPQLPFQFAPAADAVHPALGDFHPLVQRWFRETLGVPSEPQIRGWPRILAGEDVLVAAPTGSGKTLSAFLGALDRLLRLALENREIGAGPQADLFAMLPEAEPEAPSHPVLSALAELDPDSLSPREALEKLYALKRMAV